MSKPILRKAWRPIARPYGARASCDRDPVRPEKASMLLAVACEAAVGHRRLRWRKGFEAQVVPAGNHRDLDLASPLNPVGLALEPAVEPAFRPSRAKPLLGTDTRRFMATRPRVELVRASEPWRSATTLFAVRHPSWKANRTMTGTVLPRSGSRRSRPHVAAHWPSAS